MTDESIFADDADWHTVEKGFLARFDGHHVDGDIYRPREPGPRSDLLVIAASGYTGIKNLYPRLFAQALTRLGYSVFALEFPGYGRSSGSASNILVSEQTDALLAAAHELRRRGDWSRQVALAWGMGAGLAFLAAEKNPAAFDGLVGANGLYDVEAAQREARGEEGYRRFLEKLDLLRSVQRETGETVYVDSFFGYPLDSDTERVVDSVLRKQTGYNSPPVHLAFVDGLLDMNVMDDLGRLEGVPALLVHGRRNPIHPFGQAQAVADAYPGSPPATLVALDGEHNDFMSIEHPVFGKMVASIDDWLAGNFLDSRAP